MRATPWHVPHLEVILPEMDSHTPRLQGRLVVNELPFVNGLVLQPLKKCYVREEVLDLPAWGGPSTRSLRLCWGKSLRCEFPIIKKMLRLRRITKVLSCSRRLISDSDRERIRIHYTRDYEAKAKHAAEFKQRILAGDPLE